MPRSIFVGAAAAIILLAAGAVVFRQLPPRYDFPLVRQIDEELEDLTNSTGSATVSEFIPVAEPGRPSPPAPLPSGHSSAIGGDEASDSIEGERGELPPSVRIEVPFIVQAPLGNWGMPYQEACEESSLIMVHHYLEGTRVTPEQADKEILDMVQWENDEFNYSADITLEEAKRVAEDYYKHKGELFYDFTIDDMKRLLAAGHPIIVPLAGRDLRNPYYSGLGPWYHMLVVTGYDRTHFITNDVGTKRGQGYRYPQQRFYDAIHNWTGAKQDIREGGKVILVLER